MDMKKRSFIIFIQLAFLSIFIISAVPILSAAAGWSDLVKRELFKQPRTLRGVVFLDNYISNATVSLYDLSGVLFHVEQNATAQDGSFAITCPLPESFKIVVTGGRLEGELFSDEVVRIIPHFYEWDSYKVNGITTLIAKYQDRYPEMPYSEVEETVKKFLSIPDDVDIADVIYSSEWFSYHFSHYLFMKEAEAIGGITYFIDQLLDEMDEGKTRSFFDTESIGSSLFQDALKFLLQGALNKIGSEGTGWILGLLNIGGGDNKITDARLQEMDKKLDEILSDLQNIIRVLKTLSKALELDTIEVEKYIVGMSAQDAITTIKTYYDQGGTSTLNYYAGLRSKDSEQAKTDIATFVYNIKGPWQIQKQVTAIHDAIIPDIGGTKGLLDLWTDEFLLKGPLSDDKLMDYYKTLERYFSVLLFYQFKGANLVVEAMNYSSGQSQTTGDSPATQYLKYNKEKTGFQDLIKAETDVFLNCVLKLIINNSGLYWQNAFLPGTAQDILARATFFIAQTLNEDHYGLRAGLLGTGNLVHDVIGAVASDRYYYGYEALGESVDIDVPNKPYDSWGTLKHPDLGTLKKDTLYTLEKFDKFVPDETSGIGTGNYNIGYVYNGDDQGPLCQATVKKYTVDYNEDPNGEIVYGYCLGALRRGGKEVIMDPSVFHKNQFTVNKSGDVNYGEEDHLDLATGSLFLKTWASNNYTGGSSNISVKLEYSHDFTFSGTQSTIAYLNIAGVANGSVYHHHENTWSNDCSIGVNIGIMKRPDYITLNQASYSKSPSTINETQHWNITLNGQLPFQLDPGNSYYVFVNVVGSGYHYSGDYNYEVDMTLNHLSLTFVNTER